MWFTSDSAGCSEVPSPFCALMIDFSSPSSNWGTNQTSCTRCTTGRYSNIHWTSCRPSTGSVGLATWFWFSGESPLPSSTPASDCASLLALLQSDHSLALKNNTTGRCYVMMRELVRPLKKNKRLYFYSPRCKPYSCLLSSVEHNSTDFHGPIIHKCVKLKTIFLWKVCHPYT